MKKLIFQTLIALLFTTTIYAQKNGMEWQRNSTVQSKSETYSNRVERYFAEDIISYYSSKPLKSQNFAIIPFSVENVNSQLTDYYSDFKNKIVEELINSNLTVTSNASSQLSNGISIDNRIEFTIDTFETNDIISFHITLSLRKSAYFKEKRNDESAYKTDMVIWFKSIYGFVNVDENEEIYKYSKEAVSDMINFIYE
ncbi:MAG: hypothetical protein WD357_05900 [Gracilimonas sp.]